MRCRNFLCLTFISVLPFGCDLEGRKNCDWVLEAEPNQADKVSKGMVGVCARNRKTMKQDCRMQTTLDYIKSVQKRRFRYEDLEVENYGIPRTIKNIKFCD